MKMWPIVKMITIALMLLFYVTRRIDPQILKKWIQKEDLEVNHLSSILGARVHGHSRIFENDDEKFSD